MEASMPASKVVSAFAPRGAKADLVCGLCYRRGVPP
jgi:hypothetical protein